MIIDISGIGPLLFEFTFGGLVLLYRMPEAARNNGAESIMWFLVPLSAAIMVFIAPAAQTVRWAMGLCQLTDDQALGINAIFAIGGGAVGALAMFAKFTDFMEERVDPVLGVPAFAKLNSILTAIGVVGIGLAAYQAARAVRRRL